MIQTTTHNFITSSIQNHITSELFHSLPNLSIVITMMIISNSNLCPRSTYYVQLSYHTSTQNFATTPQHQFKHYFAATRRCTRDASCSRAALRDSSQTLRYMVCIFLVVNKTSGKMVVNTTKKRVYNSSTSHILHSYGASSKASSRAPRYIILH
jgi:hypothetical protein